MRKQRLGAIEKEISKVISQVLFEEIKNKKIKGLLSVTRVRVTPDSKFADVSFSALANPGKEVNQEMILEGLNEVRGYFRKRVSEELGLRYTPEIRVKLDDSIEHAVNISKILDEVKR